MTKAKFILTKKYQFAKHDKDGKDRNYLLYFLNGKQILKQKVPFDSEAERGYDKNTRIFDEHIENGRIHQTRTHLGVSRKVSFPLSKNKLNELGVNNETTIYISK